MTQFFAYTSVLLLMTLCLVTSIASANPSYTGPLACLEISEEIQAALKEGKPVVALESTIISHGMPYPENVQTARAVEQVVRDEGAIPATIGVIQGKLKVGLSDEDLEILGKDREVLKLSARDLPFALAKNRSGGTTVAGTIKIAELAGISVFATGGIGGVHRGAGETFDVSADLAQIANSKMLVVCAGAKSILDIGLTLEKLETLGVPVIGYQTDAFPAFYYRDSGFKATHRLDSAEEVAGFLRYNRDLQLAGGTLLAVPVPEETALERGYVEGAVSAALVQADEQGIHGKAVTPFLLQKVVEKTGGKSLETNIALIKNNARVAAQVAKSAAQG